MPQSYIRNGKFEPNKVLPFITPHDRKFKRNYMSDDGKLHSVKMASHRYWCFSEHGMNCVKCGIEGKFFALESHKYNSGNKFYHFNLYALDEDGNEVLMTKDHVLPKSKGGKSHISNYQTMCYKCNHEKGNKIKEI
jgi:hypothetical protein